MSQNVWVMSKVKPAAGSCTTTIPHSCQTMKPRNSAKIDQRRLRVATARPPPSHCSAFSGSQFSMLRPAVVMMGSESVVAVVVVGGASVVSVIVFSSWLCALGAAWLGGDQHSTVDDADVEGGESQGRCREAFARVEVVDLFVQRGGNR